jgi:protein gp37
MGSETAIGWTDHTFNPWWGCTRVSPGCQHCYAETFAKRTGNPVWGKEAPRRFFGDKHWNDPIKWDRAAEKAGRPALVFCASMADVFEDREDLIEHRERLFALIESTPHLIWQLLTKRPENVGHWDCGEWVGYMPAANVWIGTTAEDQQRADERVPHLLRIPAAVRFLSCEPLLGPVDLTGRALGAWRSVCGILHDEYETRIKYENLARSGIGWVIAGGESGPGHRKLNVDHARTLREQCDRAGIPFFFKQHGGQHPTSGGDELDGRTWKQFPAVADRGES